VAEGRLANAGSWAARAADTLSPPHQYASEVNFLPIYGNLTPVRLPMTFNHHCGVMALMRKAYATGVSFGPLPLPNCKAASKKHE
jgi:hypothetical protein